MFVIGRKSIPWQDHEMIYVNGIPCVYTVVYTKRAAGVLVCLPGGKKEFLADLKSRGMRITEPRTWRKGDYV